TVFSELLQESLESTIDHVFEDWESNDAVALWNMVFNEGGVGSIRTRRYDQASERIFGNSRDTEEKEESPWISDGLVSFGDSNPSNSGPDPNSGWPTESAEQITELLQAGFLPSKCSHLAAMMKSYLTMEVKRITQGYHIPVKRSAEVFAAPDFSRTLKPGEVFFRSSRQCALIDDDDMIDGIFHGNIIASIFRYPTKTPSDARLVKAVDYPQLREFTDILLFSVLGKRSEASILAGGDYDGDTICMLAEPRLHLEMAVRRGHEILNTTSSQNEAENIRELQMTLLDDVTREDRCGLYSNMSDIATYVYGYDSHKTHYLSYMHFNELDAGKSGIHVKKEVWEKDSKEFKSLSLPSCMRKPESGRRKRAKKQPENDPPRSKELGPFVLDVLKPFAKAQEERYIQLIKKLDLDADADCDPALLAPLQSADSRAKLLQKEGQDGMWHELESLKNFVKGNRKAWAELFKDTRPPFVASSPLTRTGSQDSVFSSDVDFFELPKAVQIDAKRGIADEFWNGFESQLKYFGEDEARRVMCSYAYFHAREKAQAAKYWGREGSFEYAFAVAFKTLAQLKGKSHGSLYSTSVEPFHSLMVPRRGIRNEGRT
ncbi:hypothetical protein FRC01_008612, partial [Tulasnella sp. 417]